MRLLSTFEMQLIESRVAACMDDGVIFPDEAAYVLTVEVPKLFAHIEALEEKASGPRRLPPPPPPPDWLDPGVSIREGGLATALIGSAAVIGVFVLFLIAVYS